MLFCITLLVKPELIRGTGQWIWCFARTVSEERGVEGRKGGYSEELGWDGMGGEKEGPDRLGWG